MSTARSFARIFAVSLKKINDGLRQGKIFFGRNRQTGIAPGFASGCAEDLKYNGENNRRGSTCEDESGRDWRIAPMIAQTVNK
jgi:hypothetical protein